MPEKIQEVLWMGDVQEVRRAQIPFCKDYVLYQESKDGTFIPYKKAGIRIDSRIDRGTLPAHLYIRKRDTVAILGETQERFNAQLKEDLISGDPERVKATFTTIVRETLAEPRGSSYEVLSRTIDYMIDGFLRDPNVMMNLVNMASADRYDTTIHGVNTCILTLGCYLKNDFKRQETKQGGIAALFHDIGKIKGENLLENQIMSNLNLIYFTSGNVMISWQSSDNNVLNKYTGKITRPKNGEGNKEVTLTATLSKGAVSDTKTFTLIVLEETKSDQRAVQ